MGKSVRGVLPGGIVEHPIDVADGVRLERAYPRPEQSMTKRAVCTLSASATASDVLTITVLLVPAAADQLF